MMDFFRFRWLTESRRKPTFAAAIPDSDSIKRITACAVGIGLKPDQITAEKDMHATVAYSRAAIEDPSEELRSLLPVEAQADSFALFGEPGNRCLVLKLRSVGLRAMYHTCRLYGASWDYPTFEGHVTLAYGVPDDFEVPKTLRPFTIRFDDVEVKKLKTDWEPK